MTLEKEPAMMPLLETLGLWAEAARELVKLNKESGSGEKDDSAPEEMTPGQHFRERNSDIRSAVDKTGS